MNVNQNGYVFVYICNDGYGRYFVKYRALCKTKEEAVNAISEWHTYGSLRYDTIKINNHFNQVLNVLYGLEEGVAPGEVKTTNCGSGTIRIYPALSDNLKDHERLVNEQRKREKEEKDRIREEKEQETLADFFKQRKGWYSVSIEITALTFGTCHRVHKTFSGDIVASCKMSAYRKAVEQMEEFCTEHSLIYESTASWKNADIEFLGMKTDYGYSVEAWEEAKKKGEI